MKLTTVELTELQQLNDKYQKHYHEYMYLGRVLLQEKEQLLKKHGLDYETHWIDLSTGDIKERKSTGNAQI